MSAISLIIKVEVEELLKVALQDGNKDCGVCCLLSIIRYYGGDVSKEYLRELTGTTKTGVSFYQLLEAATFLGFSCEGVKGEISFLDHSRLPCIAHIIYQKKYQHFVVIYELDVNKREIVLMDPAKGKVILPFSEFIMLSSGYFLYLTPIKTLPVFYEKKTLSLFIRHFCKCYKLYFFLVLVSSIICLWCELIIAFHFQYLFDYAITYSVFSFALKFSFFLSLFYLNLLCFNYLKNFLLTKISLIFDKELIFYVYKQILLLPYLFFKNRTLGEVLERLQDVIKVKNFILRLFSSFIIKFFFFVVFLWLLFKVHWLFVVLLFCYIFLSLCFSFSLFKIKKKRQKKILSKWDFIQSLLVETFQNVDTVKGLHLEYLFLEQFHNEYDNFLVKNYNLEKVLLLENHVKQILFYVILITFYIIGSYMLIYNHLTIGEFFVCQYIFNYLTKYCDEFFSFLFESYQIPLLISRVQDLFSLSRENFDGGSYYQFMQLSGNIVFSHLSFSYSSRNLFSDFSFVIYSGQKVLLTGKSGSGKSSLVKILMRYLDVPYGMVKIGDFDINHIHLDVLRQRISYVTGEELLFSNTLLYNIILNRDVDKEKVKEICRLILLDDLIEKLPLGYHSIVEENGFNFSSGERQKILLARALIKNSDIYIFDEAFHQIDMEQEKIILKNIFSYLDGKTIIVISHRLQHLELYDKKYRLEKGLLNEF